MTLLFAKVFLSLGAISTTLFFLFWVSLVGLIYRIEKEKVETAKDLVKQQESVAKVATFFFILCLILYTIAIVLLIFA